MKFRSKAAHLDNLIDEAIVDRYNESEVKNKCLSQRPQGSQRRKKHK